MGVARFPPPFLYTAVPVVVVVALAIGVVVCVYTLHTLLFRFLSFFPFSIIFFGVCHKPCKNREFLHFGKLVWQWRCCLSALFGLCKTKKKYVNWRTIEREMYVM